jgi:hypothetical protein
MAFCNRGNSAPDRIEHRRSIREEPNMPDTQKIRGRVKKAAYIWATEGIGAMLSQTLFHVQWLMGKKHQE